MSEKGEVYRAMITISETVAEFIKNLAVVIESGKLEQLERQKKDELIGNMYTLSEKLISLRNSMVQLSSKEEGHNGGNKE